MPPDENLRLRLFVATHKPWPLPEEHPLYWPIGLGGYSPEGHVQAYRDSDGDNIAALNPHYSELTGWYWIRKNIRDIDRVGLCHYRRYFCFDTRHPDFALDKIYMEPTPANMQALCSVDPTPVIMAAYRNNEVIVPRPANLGISISEQYARCHRSSDWDAFLQAISETSPAHAQHIPYFDTDSRMYLYNMMIAPWPFFVEYMDLLMTVLGKVESLIDYPEDPYQKRVPAFLAERMFTLHLVTTRPNLLEIPVVITDRNAY